MSDSGQPRRTIERERFQRPGDTRFGASRFEDRLAEKRVAEICDGMLRRLTELQTGEDGTGLPGRKGWRRPQD